MKRFKILGEAVLFAGGLLLFWVSFKASDPQKILDLLPLLPGPGLAVLFFYPVMCCWDVAGWKMVFGKEWKEKLPFAELFRIRLAGEALNNITPVLDIGGEPLKISLLSQRLGVPRKTALSAGVVDRTILLFSESFFVILGLLASLALLPMPGIWRAAFVAAAACALLFTALLFTLERRGLFVTFSQWARHFRPNSKISQPFRDVDQHITHFYKHENRLFWRATGFHFMGWAFGGIEMFWMLRIAGADVTLAQGFVFEALLQLVRMASCFIPANLGAQEGGLAFLVQMIGIHPSVGIFTSLLKRLRQLVWTLAGFLVWGIYQWKRARVPNAETA